MASLVRPRVAPWVLPVLLVLPAVLGPVAPLGSTSRIADGTHGLAYLSGSVSGTVTWNGVDVSTASKPSSALTVGYNTKVDVRFYWNSTTPGTHLTIGTARLQMFYFGFALVSRDVQSVSPAPASGGSFDMAWDAAATIRWILEGSFALTASLLAPNGTAMWSQGFYLHLNAPYGVLAALPILLVILILLELYAVVVSGSEGAKKPTVGTPKTTRPAKEEPPEPAETPSDTTEAGTEPKEPT